MFSKKINLTKTIESEANIIFIDELKTESCDIKLKGGRMLKTIVEDFFNNSKYFDCLLYTLFLQQTHIKLL